MPTLSWILKKRSGPAIVSLACALLFLPACRRPKSEPTNAGAPRIVSLAPAMTESLFAIGAGKNVVGRTRYCDTPKEAEDVQVIGGFADPNVEAILLLRPTLLVGSPSPAIESLRRSLSGTTIVAFSTNSILEVEAMLLDLGTRTGNDARPIVHDMNRQIVEVDRAFASVPPRRVLLLFGLSPIVAAGRTGFAADMLAHVKTENVVDDPAAYPIIDGEHLQRLRPDLVLLALGTGRPDVLPEALRQLPAVREGRVVDVNDARVIRPGPRLVGGMLALGKLIHPEVEFELAPTSSKGVEGRTP